MEQEREDASIAIRALQSYTVFEGNPEIAILQLGFIAIARILYFIAIILYKRLK